MALVVTPTLASIAPAGRPSLGRSRGGTGAMTFPRPSTSSPRQPAKPIGRSGRSSRGSIQVAASPLPIADIAALFDNPFSKAAEQVDSSLPGWFPALSFIAYVLVLREVRRIRQREERKAREKMAKAAQEAAQRKVESMGPEVWGKLIVCLVIDALGDSSFLLPGLGEGTDIAYAPLEAFLLSQLFRSNVVSGVGFVEEALPFTDVIPTATLAWMTETFFSDTWPGRALGLGGDKPVEKEKDEKKDE